MGTPTNAKAEWHVADGEDGKSETFRLLNMIHAMAGMLANSNNKQFQLAKTYTERDYVFTEWTNGIVDVGAETFKDYDGEPVSHHYYIRPCRVDDLA